MKVGLDSGMHLLPIKKHCSICTESSHSQWPNCRQGVRADCKDIKHAVIGNRFWGVPAHNVPPATIAIALPFSIRKVIGNDQALLGDCLCAGVYWTSQEA